MVNRPCCVPGCDGFGYHPPSHPKPLRQCLKHLVEAKRNRRHNHPSVVLREPFRALGTAPVQPQQKHTTPKDEQPGQDKGYKPRRVGVLRALSRPGFGL